MNEWITAQELADKLGLNIHTIYRMTQRKDIPFIKVGRVYRYDYEAVVAKLTAPAPSWAQSARSTGRKRVA